MHQEDSRQERSNRPEQNEERQRPSKRVKLDDFSEPVAPERSQDLAKFLHEGQDKELNSKKDLLQEDKELNRNHPDRSKKANKHTRSSNHQEDDGKNESQMNKGARQKPIASNEKKGKQAEGRQRANTEAKDERRVKNLVVTQGVDNVPVDHQCPNSRQLRVYEHNRVFYSATLSQSSLAQDNNKFFIVQLLQRGQGEDSEYYLYSRWGRVGVTGQTAFSNQLPLKEALRQYNSKSQDKVRRGGYRKVEVNYGRGIEEFDLITECMKIKGSDLPMPVQDLVRMIFDMGMMQGEMMESGYDEKRSPLGLIAQGSIDQGYRALNKIMKLLKADQGLSELQKRRQLSECSSEFYSAIPHDFGYMNMQAFILNTQEKVKQKLQMLTSLSQIQIYTKLMKEKPADSDLPDIDIKYEKLGVEITPIDLRSKEAAPIVSYLHNTHGCTHNRFRIRLDGIFGLRRSGEDQNYRHDLPNKMLLWHGSRLANYVGILSQGLKIAPYEAPATGYMFGKGIYFADVVSKSANYCKPVSGNKGLLLLCEVALGNMNEKMGPDYHGHRLPEGKHSTKGVGKYMPQGGETMGEVTIPNGELVASGVGETSLMYNEFVVYNRSQIQCRYIVEVTFEGCE